MSLSAFFWIGELDISPAAVEVTDISFEVSLVRAKIYLRFSKTDLNRSGADAFLGFTGGPLCPITAISIYLRVRPLCSGPLFVSADGRPVSRMKFVMGVLSSAQVDSEGYTAFGSALPRLSKLT